MKNVIKSSGYKKTLATLGLGLSSAAAFAAGTENSSGTSGMVVVGFFVVLVGLLLLPTIGHKTHH